MKYKALMLDVDGTILPYHHHAQPSKKVVNAIREASKYVHVALATGRPYFMLEELLTTLSMQKGLVIMNDGAQVMDIKTNMYLYKRPMLTGDVTQIMQILETNGISFFLNDGVRDSIGEKIPPKRMILNIFTMQKMTEEEADNAIALLTHIPTIKANKTHYGDADTYELLISHAEATKLHGVVEASKVFGVKREEIIGVGDSGNDFSLLMASGLKVAMGNAMEGLKEIADYIAPSVDEDGVADVIERFILPKEAKA